MATFKVGQKVTADDMNVAALPGEIIARHTRTTDSATTTTTTGIGVIELAANVKAGHRIRVEMSPAHLNSTVVTDNIQAKITYTENGASPSASGPVLGGASVFSKGVPMPLVGWYTPATDLTLKVWVCVARESGTGAVGLVGTTFGRQMELVIVDCGVDPGITGTNL